MLLEQYRENQAVRSFRFGAGIVHVVRSFHLLRVKYSFLNVYYKAERTWSILIELLLFYEIMYSFLLVFLSWHVCARKQTSPRVTTLIRPACENCLVRTLQWNKTHVLSILKTVPTTTQQSQSNIAELINKTFHCLHRYRSERCFLWLIG